MHEDTRRSDASARSPVDRYTETEFVTEAVETTVTDAAVEQVLETLTDAVADFCAATTDEDTAIRLLTTDETVREADTARKEDPEPLTERVFVEPLFDALGYDDLAQEVGDMSETYGKKADYAASFTDVSGVDSERLLVEAEPLNRSLDGDRHGLGQVSDWLSYRPFAAEFGIATDGLRWVLVTYDDDAYSLDTLATVDLRPVARALVADRRGLSISPDETSLDDDERDSSSRRSEAGELGGTAAETTAWGEDDVRALLERFVAGFSFDNVVATARDARQLISERRAAITDEFYDEYVSHVFGRSPSGEARPERSLIGDGVRAPDTATGDDVRLFAVGLLNRLVFVKFLEDRGLVEDRLLERIVTEHRDSNVPLSLYETYLEPLFFGVLDERQGDRSQRIQTITRYSEMPYLDGGLFRPTESYTADVDDTAFDVVDSVMYDLIALLERYDFSSTGRPGELDPSVLGNVFEKTINYITTDTGDQKKELGAYYTPDEITRFCAEQTVLPSLRDEIAAYLQAEHGYTEAMLADADDVFSLIDSLPPNERLVEEVLTEVVDEFRTLDPACGSGHFLTSVESEIVRVRKALYDVAYGQLPDDDPRDETPPTWQLRKQTVVTNVYGVDIVEPAVEITKLRLWLSIVAAVERGAVDSYEPDDLALPNIVFSVQQGNSLIGFTDLVETTADNNDAGEGSNNGSQAVLDNWGPESVAEKYEDVIEAMERHEAATDTATAAEYLREAEDKKESYRPDLDAKIHQRFRDAGVDVTPQRVTEYDPFHWVLEFAPVYADGGFDVIVGNPPWNRIKPSRDDFFSTYDDETAFRSLRGDEKDERQAALLERPAVAEAWDAYQRDVEIRATYFNDGPDYEMQESTVAGRTQASENDLSSLFLERVFDLARGDGYVSQVLPGRIFHGAPTKTLREYLLDETTVRSLVSFENHGIFDNVDTRYNFGVVTFENSGETDQFRGVFQHTDTSVLEDTAALVEIPREILTSFAPSSLVFPRVQSADDLGVLASAFQFPAVSDEDRPWYAVPRRPLDKTADSERFYDDPTGCDYPIVTGRNCYSYSYDPTFVEDLEPPFQWSVDEETNPDRSAKRRIREKSYRRLKRALYDAFDGTGSQKRFVNELLREERGDELSLRDVLLPSTEYRLGFRRVARATDEKSTIAAVVPPGPVCDYSFYVVDPFEISPERGDLTETPLHSVYERVFTDRELFVALGLLNSLPFDFLVGRKIDNSIPIYSFNETQVPALTAGDDWFDYVSERAARLNCYGEAFTEMRERLGGVTPATEPAERERLRAEIDAAAFHAYGLDRSETAFVLDDFHRVEDPRLLTDDYFDRVLEVYDRITESDSE